MAFPVYVAVVLSLLTAVLGFSGYGEEPILRKGHKGYQGISGLRVPAA
jgi:hypothetical protein